MIDSICVFHNFGSNKVYQFFFLRLKIGDFSVVRRTSVVDGADVNLVRVPLDHLLLQLLVIRETLEKTKHQKHLVKFVVDTFHI